MVDFCAFSYIYKQGINRITSWSKQRFTIMYIIMYKFLTNRYS